MGILDEKLGETNVTYGEVQKHLLDNAGLKEGEAEIKEGKSIRIGIGMGFVSHIMKLDLVWDKHHPELPEKLVIKIPTTKSIETAITNQLGVDAKDETMASAFEKFLPMMHSAECNFYETFRKESPVPIPKIYYTQEMGEGKTGQIGMQDFTVCDGTNVSMFDGYRLEQLFHITEGLADLAAYTYNNQDWTKTFPPLQMDQFKDFFSMLDKMIDACMAMNPKFSKEKLDKIKPLITFDKLTAGFDKLMNDPDFPKCLVHGDLWFNNLFFTKDEKKGTSDEVLAFIDWQGCHPGGPIEDLGRMMVSSVDPAIRRRYTKTVLHHFYDRVCSQTKKPPYSFEFLEEMYTEYFPMAMSFFAFGIPIMAGPQSPMLADKSAEEAKRCSDAMWARGEAALDDAVAIVDSGFFKDR